MAAMISEQSAARPRNDTGSLDKAAVRARVFEHLSGLVVIPTVNALRARGVLQLLRQAADWVSFSDIIKATSANPGYLKVALRLMTGSGWLQQCVTAGQRMDRYALTPEGRIALESAHESFTAVAPFLAEAVSLQRALFDVDGADLIPGFLTLISQARQSLQFKDSSEPVSAKVRERIEGYVNGALVAPSMVALSRHGIFEQLKSGPIHLKPVAPADKPDKDALLRVVFETLATQGWVELKCDDVAITPAGIYASQIAPSYGVTVSYLPTLTGLETLLFGDAKAPRLDANGDEILVDREMNVWGSGGAHSTYFKKVDEIVVDIFNRPLDEQPVGICDMGCGDATFLLHIYATIQAKTARGKVLDSHPLVLVGADYNEVARQVSRDALQKAGVSNFHVIHGDINDPDALAKSFAELGFDIHNFFHVRSFLDHNRPFVPSPDYVVGSRTAHSSGAFARLGEEIPADELEENLVRHMSRWARYVGRFGLLMLELHTLPPELTAANLAKTPAVAYDGTHGYSDQYLIEVPVFLECVREAGLVPDPLHQAKFPPSDLATVSVNLYTAAKA